MSEDKELQNFIPAASLDLTFEIPKNLEFGEDKRMIVYMINGDVLAYPNVLEYSVSRYHLFLSIRIADNKCQSVCIPKNLIQIAQKYKPLLNRYTSINLASKSLVKKSN